MTLRDLFRTRPDPEWKNPDVNVRLNAVRQLADSDQELIRALAQEDEAAAVRRAAVRKIDDTGVLAALLASEKDETVRDEVFGKLVSVASAAEDPARSEAALAAITEPRHLATVAKSAALEPLRSASLARIADGKLLGQVARDAADAATRMAALERIEDVAVVASVAMGSEHKDVAVAAVERLTDADELRPIAARAHNKAAARRAKALIEARSGVAASATPQERRRRQIRACESLEALVRSQDWGKLQDAIADAEAVWQDWKEGAESAIAERFEAARRLLETRMAAHQKEIGEALARQQAQQHGLDERTRLCERAEAAAAGDTTVSVDELRQAWNSLEVLEDAAIAALGPRFERAAAAAQARVDAESSAQLLRPQAEAICVEAETAAEEADLREASRWIAAIEKRWTELHGARPAAAELAERFRRAVARLRERQSQTQAERDKEARENAARLEALCKTLETLAGQEKPSLKEADRVLRESREALENLGPLASKEQREDLAARLKRARQTLYPKVQEQKENVDWQRWANVGVQEDLCRRVEALLPREDLEAVAEELRAIDAAWKQASSVPKEKGEPLWQRFKNAREQLRAKCDAFFAARAAEHAENAKKKLALIEKVEALSGSTEWVKTAQEIQAVQAEWKTIGATSRGQSKSLWDRFHTACDTFFKRRKEDRSHRKEEWSKNREQKEALCVRAEALADSEDWDATAAELRKLQADWKAIGPVDRKHSDAIWERFRGACNRFFERFGKRHELARAGVVTTLEALCQEMESLVPADAAGPAPEGLLERVQAAQLSWRQAGTVPEPQMGALLTRFATARSGVVTAYPDAFRGTDLDVDANRKKMEKLVARVEALVDELLPKKVEVSTQDLASQLRNALAANTIGGKAAKEERWRTAIEEMEGTQSAWRRIGAVPGADGQKLTERFQAACAKLQSERPKSAEPRPTTEKRPEGKRDGRRHDRTARPNR
jgi:hypothetical protein